MTTLRRLVGIPRPVPILPKATVYARGVARTWPPATDPWDAPLVFHWREAEL